MKSTEKLHALGQSLWLDNITRTLLDDGTLARYIRWCSVTGLTSNPSIFQKAMAEGDAYDADIAAASADTATEALFIRMALADIVGAADLFHETHVRSNGTDGWASMEVSPLLADDAAATVRAAKRLRRHAGRDNVFIKIPGTPAGLEAIEQSTFAGIPINVTLLFSREQYLAAANAYLRGIERRIAAGLDPRVDSAASLFVSRWDVAVKDKVPRALRNRLGIAIARRTYKAYRELLASPRWRALAGAGARVQRLLWASTGTKDPEAPDTLYIEALAAPDTINTIPDKTLLAFADHGHVEGAMPVDGGDAEQVIDEFRRAGVDDAGVADQLQVEGTQAFDKSWRDLLDCIAAKSEALEKTAPARG